MADNHLHFNQFQTKKRVRKRDGEGRMKKKGAKRHWPTSIVKCSTMLIPAFN